MPENSFVALKDRVKEEAALMGQHCSDRMAKNIARMVWNAGVDQRDAADGLTDLNTHSDPTAREAIRRALNAFFDQAVAA